MSDIDIHVTWGPDAEKLSPDERQEIIETLRANAETDRRQREAAKKALEGLPFVAIPIDQLADIYKSLKRLTKLGQATMDEWMAMPKAEQDLRHAIFAEADFAAVYAGQWLPHDVRDEARAKARR